MVISPKIGITFSHPHLKHLGLPVDDALNLAIQMNFSHIRLGSYWNQIEVSKDIYDFSQLESLLRRCEESNQKVIMNVGMKSPRWPEYYFPEYLKGENIDDKEVHERVLSFIEKCLMVLKKYSCIACWQIENEPLDPSGPDNRTIPIGLLTSEVFLVKRLDNRPILLTIWGNDLKSRQLLPFISPIAGCIGVDIYYRQYTRTLFGKNYYSGPRTSHNYLKHIIHSSNKDIFITELQAEPWEENEKGYVSKNPQSISPELLSENIKRAIDLGVSEIILWGFEYWYYQLKQGNSTYMELVKKYIGK